MSLIELLTALRRQDIEIWIEQDQLCYSAPKGALSPELREALVAHKADIVAFLRQAAPAGADEPPLRGVAREEPLPLSFTQQRLWFLDQLMPDSAAYNIPALVRLTGELDNVALEQSLAEVIRRHEILRTTFQSIQGRPVQVIGGQVPRWFSRADLRSIPAARRAAAVERVLADEQSRSFDLARGPLLRGKLVRLEDQEHVLALTLHHIIADGWSLGVLLRELAAIYPARVQGLPSPLPDLPIQYADVVCWQRERLEGARLERLLRYWTEQLRDAPMLQLPTDAPRLLRQIYRGGRQTRTLPAGLAGQLKSLSHQTGATLFITMLAAFQALLARVTGQDDIVVGTPIANRNRPEFEQLIGLFVDIVVLRGDLSGDPSFTELLRRVREVAISAYEYQDLPFDRLVEALQPQRNLAMTPLFTVAFNMLNFPFQRLALSGVELELLRTPDVEAKFDLTLYVEEQGDDIQLDLVYNADLFAQARIAELLDQYVTLLAQVVDQPEERLSQVSLVTSQARARLPDAGNPLPLEWFGAVQERFAEQARCVPGDTALVDMHGAWSYAELDRRSNQLANYLRAHGVAPQDVVAIYGHRSGALVWALLGVLKAGAAFVVLDPAYPGLRLSDYVRRAQPRGMIRLEAAGPCPPELEAALAGLECACQVVLPASAGVGAASPVLEMPPDPPDVAVDPDGLAYLAFTSGSTGEPKGILGTHRPLSHFFHWYTGRFELKASDRFSMLSGLSHDPLLRDVFAPLWVGAQLCIPDPAQLALFGWLVHWMKQQAISVAHITPALAQLITATLPATPNPLAAALLPDLRYLFFGGDTLTRQDVARLRTIAPHATCVNVYGATETPQIMSYWVVPDQAGPAPDAPAAEHNGRIPVGHGIEGAQLLVLTPARQLAGIGEAGEVAIRSPYLARGYLGRPDLTAERFIPNPFSLEDGGWRMENSLYPPSSSRLYLTGDRGRYLLDGAVELIGRSDDQVKVRSFRVEPGEIAATLLRHPAVWQSIVAAHNDSTGNARLVAYIVGEEREQLTVGALREFLSRWLPDYMLPASYIFLDSLPLLPNGKVDRAALPSHDPARPDLGVAFVGPRTPVEEVLAEIWRTLLGVEQFGIHGNFFVLGGHSLLATQLLSRIQETFRIDLSLSALFDIGTIAELAEVIEQKLLAKIEALPEEEAEREVVQQARRTRL